MKTKINVFSDSRVKPFLNELLYGYNILFVDLNEMNIKLNNEKTNVIFLNNEYNISAINSKNLNNNCIIFSVQENLPINTRCKIITTPAPINYIKTTIENFIESLNIKFHDISINNETLTNIKNNSYCYLTKLESEILSHLILEKETTKNYIKENILNIKSTIQTNSLDSHLTRIRKKMNQIQTTVKIQSKNEKLLIII